MKGRRPDLIFILSIILLVSAAFFSFKHLQLARQNQNARIKLSEVNSIRYGLLDANEWKDELATIVTNKIEEFELTPDNQVQLKLQVENLMYKLLNQVEQILKDDMGKIKQFLMNAFVDLDKLRENIPQLSEQLLNELSKPENKERIKGLILEKLDDYVEETFNTDEQNKLKEILAEENFTSKEEVAEVLENRILQISQKIELFIILLLSSLISVFLLNSLTSHRKSKRGLLLLLITTLLFLVNGITVPMIDIEAKITSITFQLLGEQIVFRDQIFFFQSKSILDVVWILVTDGKPDMIFVGLLIFGFSVLFPVTKIICSYLMIVSPNKYSASGFVQFFTFKSGKWSMADVFVVAMFMAFIGFSGIIGSQLEYLKDVNKYVEVLTTNGTNLKSGFYLFVLFCLAGLFLSMIIQNNINSNAQEEHK